MRVLFVDDEPIITQGLRVLIDWEAEGYEIAGSLANGKEVLKFLEEEQVDLVLTDIRMPECSGLELLETVKKEQLSDAMFIIMSGFDEFDYAKQALKLGCMDYILKPVDREELLSVVGRVRTIWEKKHVEEQRLNEL